MGCVTGNRSILNKSCSKAKWKDFCPYLLAVVRALLESLKNLKDLYMLTAFFLFIAALLSYHCYSDFLHKKCVFEELDNSTSENCLNYIDYDDSWRYLDNEEVPCGNAVGSRKCHECTKCVISGTNPLHGYMNFDSFGWAALQVFGLLNLHSWGYLFRQIVAATGYDGAFYFSILYLMFVYLFGLYVAVVKTTFLKLLKKVEGSKKNGIGAEMPERQEAAEDTLVDIGNVQPISNEDEEQQAADPSFKAVILSKCHSFVDIFCAWNCCKCCLTLRNIIARIILHPLMELLITVLIICCSLLLLLDHHNMTVEFYLAIAHIYYVFIYSFLLEAVLKIIALSPKGYFTCCWNTFDFILVSVDFFFPPFGLGGGYLGFRILRVVRVFQLTTLLPSCSRLIAILGWSWKYIKNIILILILFICVFAAIGYAAFSSSYSSEVVRVTFEGLPRLRFQSYYHSFVTVFYTITAVYGYKALWDSLLSVAVLFIPFFVIVVIIGHLLLKVFFAAVVLTSFTYVKSGPHPSAKHAEKLYETRLYFSKPFQVLKKIFRRKTYSPNEAIQLQDAKNEVYPEVTELEHFGNGQNTELNASENSKRKERRRSSVDVENCCPILCYSCIPQNFIKATAWNKLRSRCLIFVRNKCFKIIIALTICLSSVILALQTTIYAKENQTVKDSLKYLLVVVLIIFALEMGLKWLAYGLYRYFRSFLCWLEFIVVMALFIDQFSCRSIKVLCILRILSLLDILTVWHNMKVILKTITSSANLVFAAVVITTFYFIPFVYMGVQLFGGKFYSCSDEEGYELNSTFIPGRENCIILNFTWENSIINFDNGINSYLAMFEVATFQGWYAISDGVDSMMVFMSPEKEINLYMYNFFILFTIIVSFFLFNLFLGIIGEAYEEQASGDVEFPNEDRRMYLEAVTKIRGTKVNKAIQKSTVKFLAAIQNIVLSRKFDTIFLAFIGLNLIILALDHKEHHTIIGAFDKFFVVVFSVECLLKITAFRTYYFRNLWNIFDIIVLILCIFELFLLKYRFPAGILRAFRFVTIRILFRQKNWCKNLQILLYALSYSIGKLLAVCVFQFSIMFIYAVFGNYFFGNINHTAMIDGVFNFETFGKSMLVLFQISAFSYWDGILAGLINEYDCYPPMDSDPGNCGNVTIGIIFLISYIFIMGFIVLNLHLSVVLESYQKAMQDVEESITTDDCKMFSNIWGQYDPEATQFINSNKLPELLSSLQMPFKTKEENKYRIVSLNITIFEDDTVYYQDVLEALARELLQRNGHAIEKLVATPVKVGLKETKPVSSTLMKQREQHCANIIQHAWHSYQNSKSKV